MMWERAFSKKLLIPLFMLFAPAVCVSSKTIKVPADFPTIQEAIYAAEDGDSIEVEDGFYFGSNIVINKKIKLESKNLFGAVLDGGGDPWSCIFLVQAETEISGFILKNADWGILQRDSQDVSWTAHDLAFLSMKESGITINQVSENFGRALLNNIIVDNSAAAFSTNDAYGIDIDNCLVTNCKHAFMGSNHIYFNVKQASVLNCLELCVEDKDPVPPPATNKIILGDGVHVLDPLLNKARNDSRYLRPLHLSNHYEEQFSIKLRDVESLTALTLNIVGDVYFRLKEYNKSAEFYEESVMIGEKLASPEIVWQAFYGLGVNDEINGRLGKAIRHYKNAIEVIETVRSELPALESKSGFLWDKLRVYESLVNLFFRLDQENPSEGAVKEAFTFAEKSKSRALLDELQEARIEHQEKLSPEMRDEKRAITREISEIQLRLHEPGISLERKQKLLSILDEIEARYKGFLIKAKILDQNVSAPIYSQPCGYEQVRDKLLDEETALLEYMIGGKNSFAFLATSKDLFIRRLDEPESLSALVINYINFLTLKEAGGFKAESGGKRLYDRLLGVFGRDMGRNIKKLIIVPDGILNLLPFEALVGEGNSGVREEGNKIGFLIHDYEICYSPSASLLAHISERRISEKRNMDLLVIANPKPEGQNPFISLFRKMFRPRQAGRKSKDINSLFPFPNLPHAVKEAKTIAEFFGNEKRVALLNENATEERLKKIRLGDFKIIHFATHGAVDDRNWWRSALILLPAKNLSEDGHLQPWEIHDSKINSDLVVLSACQTGKGKLEKGEGMIGLTRAFFYAGTRSVVSTLWSINDESTSQFMKYFYQFLSEGKSKGSALRLAKLRMINTLYGHPYHWASFVLIGDYVSSLY